jgi:hypothetical protein
MRPREMRYFFSIAGAVQDPDDEGYELPSISDARIEAVKAASEYLHDRPEVVWLGDEFRVEVTDGAGALQFTFVAIGVDARHP